MKSINLRNRKTQKPNRFLKLNTKFCTYTPLNCVSLYITGLICIDASPCMEVYKCQVYNKLYYNYVKMDITFLFTSWAFFRIVIVVVIIIGLSCKLVLQRQILIVITYHNLSDNVSFQIDNRSSYISYV